ncbi:hypothetical protein P280DRAFT_179158 [Massarina eburnea CBS 473.64]|uniref:Uncharacterized protein n=1 Tax=Massarina eburnea CBS 473.64 TaxID=1395130 RepID=A0A6A6SAF1_9PLEO|nr:hypothetical protein P280DRAFT_179158 [Massarina eburnea CBS 473.64]
MRVCTRGRGVSCRGEGVGGGGEGEGSRLADKQVDERKRQARYNRNASGAGANLETGGRQRKPEGRRDYATKKKGHSGRWAGEVRRQLFFQRRGPSELDPGRYSCVGADDERFDCAVVHKSGTRASTALPRKLRDAVTSTGCRERGRGGGRRLAEQELESRIQALKLVAGRGAVATTDRQLVSQAGWHSTVKWLGGWRQHAAEGLLVCGSWTARGLLARGGGGREGGRER